MTGPSPGKRRRRRAAKSAGEDEASNPPVPSPLVPKAAPAPEAAETFPPSGAIPTIPPQPPDTTSRPDDPVKALGEAAVAGAVARRGSFAHVGRSTKQASRAAADETLKSPKSTPATTGESPGRESVGADSNEKSAPRATTPRHHADYSGAHEPMSNFWRRPSVLISLSLVAAVGIALGLLGTVFRPNAIVLNPHVVLDPLPTPSISPTDTAGESEFLEALPRATIDFGLSEYTAMPSSELYAWPARAAEGWVLTYAGPEDETITVTAVQHYHEDDALAAFEVLAPPPLPDVEPTPNLSATPEPSPSPAPVARGEVRVGDAVVGESVRLQISAVVPDEGDPVPERAQIIWRNSTAVMVMVGAPHVVDALFLEYGV